VSADSGRCVPTMRAALAWACQAPVETQAHRVIACPGTPSQLQPSTTAPEDQCLRGKAHTIGQPERYLKLPVNA
ncbi:hypothetical protein, partial [Paraburkholderia sp. J11-2]|uniref:hypothetical protein n=1 Tax=Paraburkholderia sp. J11-2 TaxID=2805431 RepID=UPI002AB62FAD